MPSAADEIDVVADIADNMAKIDAALHAIATAGVAVYVGDSPPPEPAVNLIWIDTSGE